MNEDTNPQMQPTQNPMGSSGGSKRMMVVIAVIVALIVVAGGALYMMSRSDDSSTDTADTGTDADSTIVVEITPEGFDPETILIEAGTTVTWTNTDSVAHGLRANPYPEGTDLPTLDSGDEIAPGGSYSYTFDEAGEFGYHDKADPTDSGEVQVN